MVYTVTSRFAVSHFLGVELGLGLGVRVKVRVMGNGEVHPHRRILR